MSLPWTLHLANVSLIKCIYKSFAFGLESFIWWMRSSPGVPAWPWALDFRTNSKDGTRPSVCRRLHPLDGVRPRISDIARSFDKSNPLWFISFISGYICCHTFSSQLPYTTQLPLLFDSGYCGGDSIKFITFRLASAKIALARIGLKVWDACLSAINEISPGKFDNYLRRKSNPRRDRCSSTQIVFAIEIEI